MDNDIPLKPNSNKWMNYLMDKWMNKLEVWNAPSFLFLTFPHPPSDNRPVSGQTKLGFLFHTLPGGHYCCERVCESGKGVGVCTHSMVRDMWKELSQIGQWKNNQEYKKR